MRKRNSSYLISGAIALLVLIGGFFYTQPVAAQALRELPDLTITHATLDGAALNFRYENIGKGDTRGIISFWYEWIDGQGRRIGDVYWQNANIVMPAKSKQIARQLHQSSTLASERGEVKLGDLIYSPPPGADHFKLTIDGPNKHAESNEQNNSVLLPVLRPDFTMTDAEFRNDFLSFRHHNRGNRGHREGEKISFWFEWVDDRGTRLGDLYWLDATPSGISPPPRLAELDSRTTLYSAKGTASFTSFLNSTPTGSTHLKITIDGPNAYAESHEGNNVVFLQKLINLGADLTIGSVVVKDRALNITVRNIGQSDAPIVDISLMWLDGKDRPTIELVAVEPISAGNEITMSISFDGLGGANKMLHDPPEGAKELRIFVDGNQKLVELNEGNNIAFINRSELRAPSSVTPTPPPPSDTTVTPRPKLNLNLSVNIIKSKRAAASLSAMAGFFRKLVYLAFPAKLYAKIQEAYPGDSARATLVAKNVGEGEATELYLSLNCPKETSLKSAELNGKKAKQNSAGWFAAPNLGKGSAHRLVVICAISAKAAEQGQSTVKFTGAARFKGETRTLQSNTVGVVVVQPKKEKSPITPPKAPQPVAPQPKAPEPLQAFPRQDLTTDSDFGF
jgi:hypothetical protein